MEKKSNKENNNKSNADETKQESSEVVKKKSFSIFLILKGILKYTFFTSFSLIIVGIVAYLTLANLAFFGFLPIKVTEKMPIVNKIVKDIEAKERRIALAKEYQEDLSQIQKAGELQIDLLEEQDIAGREFVPFLYKLRVVKNKINNKDLAEVWVDNVLVMRIFVGVGSNPPYARATYVVREINKLLNDKADFNKLLPVIDEEHYYAEINGKELFQVSEEDAIFNNSTQIELLYSWVNNLRVSLGASLFQVPKFVVKKADIPEERKPTSTTQLPPSVATPTQEDSTPTIVPQEPLTPTEEELLRIKQVKNVVKVYEKMPEEKVVKIFNRMKQAEVVEIFKYMSVKKIIKVFPLMPAYRDIGVYRATISVGTEEENNKMFKKFLQVWEKIPDEQMIPILKRMTVDEKLAIFRKMSVKKKAKIFELMPTEEAKRYLQLLEEIPK